jgi:hypothetical protein
MQLLLELMDLPRIMDIQNTWLLNHLVRIIAEKTWRCEQEIPSYGREASYLYGDDATEFASSFSCCTVRSCGVPASDPIERLIRRLRRPHGQADLWGDGENFGKELICYFGLVDPLSSDTIVQIT